MFSSGQKRSRVSKSVAIRRPSTARSWLFDQLQRPQLQVRLGTCLFAVILLVISVQSWQAPFPYRLGDYVPHGIAAKIAFERVNVEETERAQRNAEESVSFIFRHHPGALAALPEALRAALGEIAQANRLEQLSEQTRKDFGLHGSDPVSGESLEAQARFDAESAADRFAALRATVLGPDLKMAQQRIDQMVEDFDQLLAPVIENGIVDPKAIERHNIAVDRRIRIVDEGADVETGYEVRLTRVRLPDLLNDAGLLGTSWDDFPSLGEAIRPALSHWLLLRAESTLQYDQAATKIARSEARESVENKIDRFNESDLLVLPGAVLDADDLELVREEYRAFEATIGWGARLTRMGIVFMMILVLAGLNGFYIYRDDRRIGAEMNRLVTYLLAIVVTVFVGQLVSFDPLRAEIVPLLTVVLLMSVAYNQFIATLTAFSLAVLLTLSTTGRFDQFIVLITTASTAIIPLQRLSSRATLIKVSFASAFAYFVVSCGMAVIETQSLEEVFRNTPGLVMSLKGAALCLVAGYLVAGSLPFIESTFGVVTDMTLLELSDPSHPLLQDLVRLAPGTYNHSISVASIAETAAERIGGNGLLVRVGAYFHDIGKMLKPQYFIENTTEGGTSRHEHLNPAMSTLIIIGHVKDGVDLAEEHALPDPIIDFIEQHHGTTLVEYFFREATRQTEGQPDYKTNAEESSFRYPGPKPQTKETGVLMIADACESACRTLTEPTPRRIESVVDNIVMRRLLDGQFDECALRMSELHTIRDSVIKSLIGIYHGRIRYPEQHEGRSAG